MKKTYKIPKLTYIIDEEPFLLTTSPGVGEDDYNDEWAIEVKSTSIQEEDEEDEEGQYVW